MLKPPEYFSGFPDQIIRTFRPIRQSSWMYRLISPDKPFGTARQPNTWIVLLILF